MVIAKLKKFWEDHLRKRDQKLKEEHKTENFQETEEMKKAEELKRDADRLAQLKQYKTAIEEYARALEIYPFKGHETDMFKSAAEFLFKCNYNMAASYSYLDDFDKAVECFDKSLAVEMADDENKIRAWMSKGSCFYRKKQIIDGSYKSGAYIISSENLLDDKKIDQLREDDKKKGFLKSAHECFSKAADLNRGNIEAWYDKGHVEFLMGKIKEAVQSFDNVINLDKNYENKENIPLFDEIKRDRGVQIKMNELVDRTEFSEPTFKTKTGHLVKTRAEMMIANFLFDNNLLFQYNTVATWADKDDFRPCFYIPKLDLYIDHHPFDYMKEYQKMMKGKIKQYEKHKKKQISITSEEEKNIEESLRLKMKPYIIL